MELTYNASVFIDKQKLIDNIKAKHLPFIADIREEEDRAIVIVLTENTRVGINEIFNMGGMIGVIEASTSYV